MDIGNDILPIRMKFAEKGTWLCIDPGNMKSGWTTCVEDKSAMGHIKILSKGIDTNREIREALSTHWGFHKNSLLLIECPRPQGMPVAAELMETLIEIGRILQMWRGPWSYVFRGEVKVTLCGTASSKDSHVVQAIKDRFGGESIAVAGKKCKKCHGNMVIGSWHCPECGKSSQAKNDCEFCDGGTNKDVYEKDDCPACERSGWEDGRGPGVLHGFADHRWHALALACHWQERHPPLVRDIAGKQPVKKKVPKRSRMSRGVPDR